MLLWLAGELNRGWLQRLKRLQKSSRLTNRASPSLRPLSLHQAMLHSIHEGKLALRALRRRDTPAGYQESQQLLPGKRLRRNRSRSNEKEVSYRHRGRAVLEVKRF